MGEHTADILVGIDERHTRSSSSTALSLSLFLVFTAVRLEKLTSHRYVVENGSNVEITWPERRTPWQQSTKNCAKEDQQSLALSHDLVSVQ